MQGCEDFCAHEVAVFDGLAMSAYPFARSMSARVGSLMIPFLQVCVGVGGVAGFRGGSAGAVRRCLLRGLAQGVGLALSRCGGEASEPGARSFQASGVAESRQVFVQALRVCFRYVDSTSWQGHAACLDRRCQFQK